VKLISISSRVISLAGLFFLLPTCALAQVIRDGSIGPDQAIQPEFLSSGRYDITEDMGEVSGSNLFHSFEQFDLSAGQGANFSGNASIQNIVSRVTGGAVSDINGKINSTIDGVNLYFLNPMGVIFGPDAKIQIPGSFNVSTADSLVFSDGAVFDISQEIDSGLLSSAPPVNFGFLSSVGESSIEVNGSDFYSNNAGLQGDLSFQANNIRIANGAAIRASNNNISLDANNIMITGDSAIVSLSGGSITFSAQNDITISGDKTLVKTASELDAVAGDINISANRFFFQEGASIQVASNGAGRGGDVYIAARERISITGLGTSIKTNSGSTGPGGNILLTAQDIDVIGSDFPVDGVTINNNTIIESHSSSTGSGGNITLFAENSLTLSGEKAFLASFNNNGGTGGDISVSAQQVFLQDDSQIITHSSSSNTGTGGDIDVRAGQDMLVSEGAIIRSLAGGLDNGGAVNINVSENLTVSGLITGIVSLSFAQANGGDVNIEANRIELSNSAEVFSYNQGSGRGADITMHAQEDIILSQGLGGIDADNLQPRIVSQTIEGGDGGDILLIARNIEIESDAPIKSHTRSNGQGGGIHLQADRITLQGLNETSGDSEVLSELGLSSDAGTSTSGSVAIFNDDVYTTNLNFASSAINTDAVGDAGDISLHAQLIEFTDGASVETNTDISGDGASISLVADIVNFSGTNSSGASSMLHTSTSHIAPAGDIRISARQVTLREGAVLFSENVVGALGATGSIYVTASEQVSISGANLNDPAAPPSLQTVSKNESDSGDIRISTPLLNLQGARINTETNAGTGGDIELNSDLIIVSNSTITTSVTGEGDGGNIDISAKVLVLAEGSAVIAQAEVGNGGAIKIDVDALIKSFDSIVDASSSAGVDGVVSVTLGAEQQQSDMPVEASFLDASSLLRGSCSENSPQGQLNIIPQGGTLISPEGPLPMADKFDALSDLPEFSALSTMAVNGRVTEQENLNNNEGSEFALIKNIGSVEYSLGQYRSSVNRLVQAVNFASQTRNSAGVADAMADLGNALVAVGRDNSAEEILLDALSKATVLSDIELSTRILNNLGNYYAVQGEFEKAFAAYQRSLSLAQDSDQTLLVAKSGANAARASLSFKNKEASMNLLANATAAVDTLIEMDDKAELYIHLAKTYESLSFHFPEGKNLNIVNSYRLYRASEAISRQSNNHRLLSYALGNLGMLYHTELRVEEALVLVRHALVAAEESGAVELLFRWHWQEGRLLREQGENESALQSFRRAVAIVEASRQASVARYESSFSYFKNLVEPIYFDFADLLLTMVADEEYLHESQPLLREARQVIEQLKTAELENYFQDGCVMRHNARRKDLDSISPEAAIIYPIILPDRLELLVSLPLSNGSDDRSLESYRVAITATNLNALLHRFRDHVENFSDNATIIQQGQQLYEYLVQPYEEMLQKRGIKTLVFVPDGALRTIPLAALHNGIDYIVRDYAIAVTSSLALTDPQPLAAREHKVLLAGVSEAVNGMSALNAVPQELKTIHQLLGGKVLLNEKFTEQSFTESVRDKDISIIHIASHAEFSTDHRNSFLQTYDAPLNTEQLYQVLSATKYRERSLELLVLSACQTASGSGQAELGLAGAGIKAGARSAMGSLWNINDAATAMLIENFYTQFSIHHRSKAESLRQAQLSVLDDPLYANPFYWSAFLLIDNWL
jgi:filamentous hemagglutinin family protein